MNSDNAFRSAARAARHHARAWLDHPGVTAVGVGLRRVGGTATWQPAAKIFVAAKLPASELAPSALLPRIVTSPDGSTAVVDVEQLSPITVPPPPGPHAATRSLSAFPLRDFMRPAAGGASVANYLFSAGTMTIGVCDAFGWYALSCNHVLALLNRALAGQPVLQPAPADGGTVATAQLGSLARFVPLDFSPGATNFVDAALALVPAGAVLASVALFGHPIAVAPPSSLYIGQPVWKVGRTTGVTVGTIAALNVIVPADYTALGGPSRALLAEQILTTPMAEFGDSGSILLDGANRAIGMLCGGSSEGAVYNRIDSVLAALGVAF